METDISKIIMDPDESYCIPILRHIPDSIEQLEIESLS